MPISFKTNENQEQMWVTNLLGVPLAILTRFFKMDTCMNQKANIIVHI